VTPASPPPLLALTLLTREDCPLCMELREALEARNAGRHTLAIDFVDVDEDPALRARHGDRVPVLLCGDTEICAGHFDPARLDGLAHA